MPRIYDDAWKRLQDLGAISAQDASNFRRGKRSPSLRKVEGWVARYGVTIRFSPENGLEVLLPT